MPATWLYAIKTALPYIESVAKLALPVFNQRKANKEASDDTHRQLAELQTAVTHNAEHVRELAVQLRTALEALDQAAAAAVAAQRHQRRLLNVVGALALLAVVLAVYAAWR